MTTVCVNQAPGKLWF